MWDGEEKNPGTLKDMSYSFVISDPDKTDMHRAKLKRSRMNIAGYLGGSFFQGWDPENDYSALQVLALVFLDNRIGRSAPFADEG